MKKKAETSRGRKQQTQKRETKKKDAVSEDISENVAESPVLNPQDEEKQDNPVPAATLTPVPPSEPQVKNTPKRATKSKAVQNPFFECTISCAFS